MVLSQDEEYEWQYLNNNQETLCIIQKVGECCCSEMFTEGGRFFPCLQTLKNTTSIHKLLSKGIWRKVHEYSLAT